MASTHIGKVVRANIVLFGPLLANLGLPLPSVAAGITGSSSMLS